MKGLTTEDRQRIEEGIRQKYTKVAISPEGNFQYPTGEAGLKGQNYNPEILRKLSGDILASYCGVGNPFSLGTIRRRGHCPRHWLRCGCGHTDCCYHGRSKRKGCGDRPHIGNA